MDHESRTSSPNDSFHRRPQSQFNVIMVHSGDPFPLNEPDTSETIDDNSQSSHGREHEDTF